MATEVILPRVDMDMAEGKIAHWYVKNGDAVTKGQVLFEIETDKATMEVDSTAEGVIDGITGEIGVSMPVGQVVAWIRAPGEAATAPAPVAAPAEAVAVPASTPTATPASSTASTAHLDVAGGMASKDHGLLRATPLARSLARERGIDLHALHGSGPQGRILGGDVPEAAASRASSAGGSTDALHLHWWQRGDGAPVLMLHGFGADHASWRPLVQQLPPSLPLVALDLPHHGKSPAPAIASFHDLAEAVARRLDDEGITACHVLGHSLGGGVALALAAARPERILSLTLLAPAGLGPEINGGFIDGLTRAATEPELKVVLSSLFHDPSMLSGSFVATAFHQLQGPGRRAALEALAARLMPDGRQAEALRPTLADLRMPMKVVWGTTDRIIPVSHAEGLPGRIALHRLMGVGHLPQIEATALVAELLAQQVRAGAAS